MRLDAGILDLHDATLISINVDWRGGVARIELRLGGGSIARVSAVGLRGITVPRSQPWGPSVSVNSARVAVGTEDGDARLSVEMQSGDEIIVDAGGFDLEIDGAP